MDGAGTAQNRNENAHNRQRLRSGSHLERRHASNRRRHSGRMERPHRRKPIEIPACRQLKRQTILPHKEVPMSADETATARIEKKLDRIETTVQKINERAVKTETSMTYIKWIAIIGFSASIGGAHFPRPETIRQNQPIGSPIGLQYRRIRRQLCESAKHDLPMQRRTANASNIGRWPMNEPEMTNNELKQFLEKKFNKRFDSIETRLDNIDVRLKKIDEDIQSNGKDLKKLDEDIRGNGKDGLNVQIVRLKSIKNWVVWVIPLTIVPLITAVLGAFFVHYFSMLGK